VERKWNVPEEIAALCARLRRGGYAAYPVGGAVRDLILGREPGDWDVATACPPAMTAALFGAAARPTGLAHGTVTVDTAAGSVEVTTFRQEGPYSDGRRPDWVRFVRELFYDLARRDFTMNAMALDIDGTLIDPFGGESDLRSGIIRTVGDPELRLKEDSLRIFRGVRFCAQLGMELGEAERRTIAAHPEWGDPASPERVRAELEKGLCARAPERLEVLFEAGLMERFTDGRAVPDLSGLKYKAAQPAARWGELCVALLDCGAVQDPEEFLRRLHMDRRTRVNALTYLPGTTKKNILQRETKNSPAMGGMA